MRGREEEERDQFYLLQLESEQLNFAKCGSVRLIKYT